MTINRVGDAARAAIIANQPRYLYTGSVDPSSTPVTLFGVTGDVAAKVIGFCVDDCTTSDAITLEVGIAGDTAIVLPQIADATSLMQGLVYDDATPTVPTFDPETVPWRFLQSTDIIQTSTGTYTAGAMKYLCWWLPLSAASNVVVA